MQLDKAAVIQSVMMVTGVATTLHVLLGTRLPLVQGSSLVYLAPAIIVANSPHNLTADPSQRFSLTMRETMGAVIVASLLQVVAGYSGFMSLLIELINPVVVAPTIMAVGLSFLSYGFPVIGRCVAIGLPELILIVIFALYLRRVSFWGSRFFQIHAISLGLAITWLYALVLTLAGVYSYPDCSPSAIYPSSSPCAEKQALMASCRTDASSVLADAKWVAPPYPFQYGMPIFRWESICVMLLPALISTIDSVSNYHATSLLVAVRPPTGGVVGRGIGMEGIASVLAGMWGTGGGATTLTENIHLVAVTRMGSRVTIIVGAAFLIFFSLFGKVGALFASMPPVMVGGLLTIMAAMAASLGLSSLRYAEMGSSRNLLITGLALFLSLSVPDYFKTYTASTGHGPINTSSSGLNFVLNSLLALPMAIAFMVAFFLDNTVPGTATERGLYVWSGRKAARADPLMHEDYDLPFGLSRFFSWVFWLGVSVHYALAPTARALISTNTRASAAAEIAESLAPELARTELICQENRRGGGGGGGGGGEEGGWRDGGGRGRTPGVTRRYWERRLVRRPLTAGTESWAHLSFRAASDHMTGAEAFSDGRPHGNSSEQDIGGRTRFSPSDMANRLTRSFDSLYWPAPKDVTCGEDSKLPEISVTGRGSPCRYPDLRVRGLSRPIMIHLNCGKLYDSINRY
ncbi:unnamed protein product [Closterium sp. NIES-54]